MSDISQRVADLRRQEAADSELALRPVRALYEPLWARLQADCAASAQGHQWQFAATTVEGHAVWRCPQCLLRETRL
jgi:hypothetical protein